MSIFFFFDVGYQFFSIIFNDFDVDYFYNRYLDFDYFVRRAGSRVSGAMCLSSDGPGIQLQKITVFYFWGPLNIRALYVLQHRQHSALFRTGKFVRHSCDAFTVGAFVDPPKNVGVSIKEARSVKKGYNNPHFLITRQ
jgi:hypothetical protein